MTTTFDALQRLIQEYKGKLSDEDYHILYYFIQVIHDLQHSDNSHRIDSLIEQRIMGTQWEKRFLELRRG